ncbi:hypothetical protein C9F11_03675 [Streptomyces sp. YIM 121038]|uniref:hypothetical protein n=1 Tax=Streptomyces sp. YIM 121038 TaxID=2136401 RepID=UPI001162AB43|nr:hypothetical protein [Streptomyces sp. YIM 121038]QCX74438.1 hypothetical protein C9F11_03675 [Streptomyces sp. YIM 121038]
MTRTSPLRTLLAVAALLLGALGGGLAAPSPARAATAACPTDDRAQGLASTPVPDSLVSVPRSDGRVAQFQQFYDTTATARLPFVWHREQEAPGGRFGPWERVSAATVGPKSYYVTAVENGDGRLELLFSAYGTFCHSAQRPGDHAWTAPEPFGLAPMPYHGGVVLFTERDGSIDAFASARPSGGSLELRRRPSPGDVWGPVESLGPLPEPNVGLSHPDRVTQLADDRLNVSVREWNRDRHWQITQTAPGGPWGPWQLCAPTGCPSPV